MELLACIGLFVGFSLLAMGFNLARRVSHS